MKKDNNGWQNNIGRIVKKENGGYFLVFERRKDKEGNYIGEDCFPMTVNEGDFFQLKLKKDDLANLVKTGRLSEEDAERICEKVKFEISRAPQKSEEPADTKSKSTKKKPKSDDGVNF